MIVLQVNKDSAERQFCMRNDCAEVQCMDEVRKPAVASLFYPDDTINLKRMINNYISNVPNETVDYFKKNAVDNYFGIIVPHAGYVYSGQIAAYAYSLIKQKSIDTVILIGPSHFTFFEGFALSYYKSFKTPLGEIPVDIELIKSLADIGKGTFDYVNTAHVKEHSLEVQLPFLQTVLNGDFKIVPILMGEQTVRNVKLGWKFYSACLKIMNGNILLLFRAIYLIIIMIRKPKNWIIG